MPLFDKWFVYALISMLFYGFWAFFPKMAVEHLRPTSALVYEVAGAVLVGLVCWGLVGVRPEFHARSTLFAVLTGISGMLGTLFFFAAAGRGKISVVVSITALYPLITIVLAACFLKEPVTLKQIIGMVFALIAIFLFSS